MVIDAEKNKISISIRTLGEIQRQLSEIEMYLLERDLSQPESIRGAIQELNATRRDLFLPLGTQRHERFEPVKG